MCDHLPRLLVTGGHGFVAGSVIQQSASSWEAHVLSRNEPVLERPALHWHRFDPRDSARLAELFTQTRPDAVIHTAALADIDYCEAHPAEARVVNVELTRSLADLCAIHHAKFVFCSTDTIFDGEHAPYGENDPPGPLNCYARTKVEAERIVAHSGAEVVIARLALVLGLPVLGAGNSFLAKIAATLRAGRELNIPADEARSPVDVITAGRALLELAGDTHTGIFHLAGNESLSRFVMARRIATRLDFSPELVVDSPAAKAPGRAPRPRDVSLDNTRARTLLRTAMLDLDDALTLILQTPSVAFP
jgi:dTDP-4-dehydrorhamnose reductase